MNSVIQFVLKIFELFSDDNGRLSSMRMMATATVFACIYLFYEVISVWKTICIAKQEFIPLNFTDFTCLLGAVAALFAKGWQKNIESKDNLYNDTSQTESPNPIIPRRRPTDIR